MFDGQFHPGQKIQFDDIGVFRNPWHRYILLDVIQRQSLTSNLELCLDAADGSSYTSGQSWLDRSGNSFDFFRGTTSGVDATDPTFNGSADGRSSSEYWSFDGGDYFQYDTTNETWMQNLHKNNALFTIVAWIRWVDTTNNRGICGTLGALAGRTGFNLRTTNAGVQFLVGNAGAIVLNVVGAGAVPAADTWTFVGLTVDEAATTGTICVNSSTTDFTSTYASPSAGNASGTMQIGSGGNGAVLTQNGDRMACFAAWEGVALTSAQMQSIYVATKGRFGV